LLAGRNWFIGGWLSELACWRCHGKHVARKAKVTAVVPAVEIVAGATNFVSCQFCRLLLRFLSVF
jgi:hypothetical protein